MKSPVATENNCFVPIVHAPNVRPWNPKGQNARSHHEDRKHIPLFRHLNVILVRPGTKSSINPQQKPTYTFLHSSSTRHGSDTPCALLQEILPLVFSHCLRSLDSSIA